MLDVLNTLERMSDLDRVTVLLVNGETLSVQVTAPRLTSNGRIDTDLLKVSIRDALGLSRNKTPQSETYQVETYHSENLFAEVSIRKIFHKGVSK